MISDRETIPLCLRSGNISCRLSRYRLFRCGQWFSSLLSFLLWLLSRLWQEWPECLWISTILLLHYMRQRFLLAHIMEYCNLTQSDKLMNNTEGLLLPLSCLSVLCSHRICKPLYFNYLRIKWEKSDDVDSVEGEEFTKLTFLTFVNLMQDWHIYTFVGVILAN